MPVNEEERSLRRRIVFRAMQGNATPEAIQTAIATLDDEFANVEHLRFNQLIQRLQQTLDSAEVNLGLVLGEIMQLRSKSPADIGPDPGVQQSSRSKANAGRGAAASTPAAPASPRGEHRVFVTVLENVVEQLGHRGDGSERSLISSVLQSSDVQNLNSGVIDPLVQWAEDPQPGYLATYGLTDDYRTIVHVVYVWLCQKLGPVQADRSLNAAIRAAEQLPEAVTHPPQQLL